MFSQRRRRKRLRKAKPGDQRPLAPYRSRQLLSRTLFFIDLPEERPAHQYAVDVRFFADELSELDSAEGNSASNPQSSLYRDGVQIYRADLPASFPVPGGAIDVASSLWGLTRIHYVRDDGSERILAPDRDAPEARRARFARKHPAASRIIGAVAILLLLVSLVVSIPQGLQIITSIDLIADNFGTFTSPINLPGWANTAILLAGFTAAIERALSLRNHWLIDADTIWTSLG